MIMIQEAYVSFETAKLLKEKGFDAEVRQYYLWDDETAHHTFNLDDREDNTNVFGVDYYSAPTQQMAMRWLREIHNLVICTEIVNENYKGNTDYTNPDRWHWFFDLTNEKGVVIEPESDYILKEFDSYEDAVEAAIKYCLTNLI